MRTRCSIKVSVYHKIGKASSYHVIREVSMVKPSADRKMRKLLTVLVMIACSRQCGIFAKTRSRLTTVTTFGRQNDACSRARSAYY